MVRLQVLQNRVTPVEAEIWFAPSEPGVVTGRLHGPKCQFATTIEISYPVQPLRGHEGKFRVLVPEPSLWDPESPFLYEGTLVHTANDSSETKHFVRQGLRLVRRDQRALVVNGKRFQIRGKRIAKLDSDQALALREQGVNTLRLGDVENAESILNLADRVGFFVLIESAGEFDAVERARWFEHPSFLVALDPTNVHELASWKLDGLDFE